MVLYFTVEFVRYIIL